MTLPDSFAFMCPVKTGAGAGALEHLPVDLASFDAARPLIITRKKSEENGLIKKIACAFKTSGLTLGVYDGIDDMAGKETVKDLCGLYLDKGFDSIIALGNGRSVDVAKAVNIAVSGKPEDLKEALETGTLTKPLRPLVYIPTGTGTARECSGEIQLEGKTIVSPYLMPDLVTMDARMLIDEDPEKIIDTALAALTYAAEAFACPKSNPCSGAYAQIVIDAVMNNLMDVVKDSLAQKGFLASLKDRLSGKESRMALTSATCMAGYVYANAPRGLAVDLARELVDMCDVKPGIAMGILLPYVLEYQAHREGRELSKIMRPMAGLDLYCSTPQGQRFDSAMGKIRHLVNELFILTSTSTPRTLEDLRLSFDTLESIAGKVADRRKEEKAGFACMAILEHAFYGKPVTA